MLMNNYEILINKENKIAEDFYKNFELIEILNVENQKIQIEKLTYEKYLKDYGFILRYHKGKEEITKYSYEPWHIRYVGDKIAKICDEKNIVLEEYYQMQNM